MLSCPDESAFCLSLKHHLKPAMGMRMPWSFGYLHCHWVTTWKRRLLPPQWLMQTDGHLWQMLTVPLLLLPPHPILLSPLLLLRWPPRTPPPWRCCSPWRCRRWCCPHWRRCCRCCPRCCRRLLD